MLRCWNAYGHSPKKNCMSRYGRLKTAGWPVKKSLAELEKPAQRMKSGNDVILIVLSGISNEPQHLAVHSGSGIALINTQVLYTDDPEIFARRIERQVMRAAAFSFGLTPTPDPFCVTRDYSSLEDLDTMGRNFSPPWQGRFAEEAEKRGLVRPDIPADDSL